jgi:hypothetical protein
MLQNKIAFLEYNFIFDPSETWSNLYQFEQTLIKYFETIGMDVQMVKTIEGVGARRILIITRKPTIVPETKQPVGRPQTMGGKFKELGARKLSKVALAFKKKK